MRRTAPLRLLGSGSRVLVRGSVATSRVHSGSIPVAPGYRQREYGCSPRRRRAATDRSSRITVYRDVLHLWGADASGNAAAESWPRPVVDRSHLKEHAMTVLLIGYAQCSTDSQDLSVQRDALVGLGVAPVRIYVDHGRDCPGFG